MEQPNKRINTSTIDVIWNVALTSSTKRDRRDPLEGYGSLARDWAGAQATYTEHILIESIILRGCSVQVGQIKTGRKVMQSMSDPVSGDGVKCLAWHLRMVLGSCRHEI